MGANWTSRTHMSNQFIIEKLSKFFILRTHNTANARTT